MIEQPLYALLKEKQYVVIPHFGALRTTSQEASITPEEQMIQPPQPLVVFDEAATNNDGLLANRLSIQHRMSFGKALTQVNETVKEWKKQLGEGHPVQLQGIGTFYPGSDGSIQLASNPDLALDPHTYGLDALQLTPVKRTPYRKRKAPARARKPVRQARKSTKPSPALLAPLSILITFVLLSLGLNVPLYQSTDNNFQASFSGIVSASSKEQPVTAYNTHSSERSGTAEVESSSDETSYHVIAGSFRYQHNAHDRVKALTQLGYQPDILETGKGLYRVRVQQYQDSTKAAAQVRSFQDSDNQPRAWLLKKE